MLCIKSRQLMPNDFVLDPLCAGRRLSHFLSFIRTFCTIPIINTNTQCSSSVKGTWPVKVLLKPSQEVHLHKRSSSQDCKLSGPTARNSLPTAVHSDLSSSSCFCRRLKTELFSRAYGVNCSGGSSPKKSGGAVLRSHYFYQYHW